MMGFACRQTGVCLTAGRIMGGVTADRAGHCTLVLAKVVELFDHLGQPRPGDVDLLVGDVHLQHRQRQLADRRQRLDR